MMIQIAGQVPDTTLPERPTQLLALLKNFSVLCNIEDEESLLDEAPIAVDGIDFYLRYDPDASPAWLTVQCDFGAVEKSRMTDVYRTLLEINLVFYAVCGPLFGVAADTGHVTFADRYRLDDITAEQLRNRLGNLAVKAKEWRAAYQGAPVIPLNNTAAMQRRLQKNRSPR